MNGDERIANLLEWNESARSNAENAIVSSMFEASSNAIQPLDTFVTWLLFGVAAIASFLIGNAEKVLPILGPGGFLVCGLLLCLSCLFGFLSKLYGLLANVGSAIGQAVRDSFMQHAKEHEEAESKIQECAERLGVTIQTNIRLDRILAEFLAPLPRVVQWHTSRKLKKLGAANPQAGYIPRVQNQSVQGFCMFAQALFFLSFLVYGFVSSAINALS